MKLDNFIKRPVLSTVISIIIVVLGLIGLMTLPISQYPAEAVKQFVSRLDGESSFLFFHSVTKIRNICFN